MKIILALFLLYLCLNCAAQTIDLNDTLITSRGIAGLSFRNSMDSIRKKNKQFKFLSRPVSDFEMEGEQSGFLVLFHSDTLFFLSPEVGRSGTIGGFEIISPRFVCPSGIRAGDAIKDCQVKNKKLNLSRDSYTENEEFFELNEIVNLYGGTFFSASLRFKSQPEDRIGMYRSERVSEKTNRFRYMNKKSSRISLIRIE